MYFINREWKINKSILRFPDMVSHQQTIHNLIDMCKYPVDLITEGHYQKPSPSDTVDTNCDQLHKLNKETIIIQALNKKQTYVCKNSQ